MNHINILIIIPLSIILLNIILWLKTKLSFYYSSRKDKIIGFILANAVFLIGIIWYLIKEFKKP
jgi:hypothetical protein